MDALTCVLCHFDVPHLPHGPDDVPITPCEACWLGLHGLCQPLAPYWCTCDCNLGKDADAR